MGHADATPSLHTAGQDPFDTLVEPQERHFMLCLPRRVGIFRHQQDRKLRCHYPADTLFELRAADLEVVRSWYMPSSESRG